MNTVVASKNRSGPRNRSGNNRKETYSVQMADLGFVSLAGLGIKEVVKSVRLTKKLLEEARWR